LQIGSVRSCDLRWRCPSVLIHASRKIQKRDYRDHMCWNTLSAFKSEGVFLLVMTDEGVKT